MRVLVALALLALPACMGIPNYQLLDREDFERGHPVLARGGTWEIVSTGEPARPQHVLQQSAQAAEGQMHLAICVARAPMAGLVEVRLEPIDGTLHQGGGVAWNVRDARNYECASWDPLHESLRVYSVADGLRKPLGEVPLQVHSGWHALRVRFDDQEVQCYFDGTWRLTVTRSRLGPAGFSALWTEADARTRFDDIEVGTWGARGIGWGPK